VLEIIEAGKNCGLSEGGVVIQQIFAKSVEEAGELTLLEGCDFKVISEHTFDNHKVIFGIL